MSVAPCPSHIMQSWTVHTKFSAEATIESRVQATAPIINDMIAAFERGEFNDGTQNFQDMVLEKIRAASLHRDDVWTQVDVVGVHPDNRERAGLVPIDVHNLLLRIFEDGFMMKAVDLLACEIPPTDEGEKWRVFNEVLANGSSGLLPHVQKRPALRSERIDYDGIGRTVCSRRERDDSGESVPNHESSSSGANNSVSRGLSAVATDAADVKLSILETNGVKKLYI